MCSLKLECGLAGGGGKKESSSMVGMTLNPLLQPKIAEEDKDDSDASSESDEEKEAKMGKKNVNSALDASVKKSEPSISTGYLTDLAAEKDNDFSGSS